MVETISRHDPLEIGWAAGIIDGEGCVTLRDQHQEHQLQGYILVGNTDYDLLRKFTEVLCKWGVHFGYQLVRQKKRWAPCVRVQITRTNSVVRLLEIVLPYLTAKKRYAELVLEFCYWRQSLRVRERPRPRAPNGCILPGSMYTQKELQKIQKFRERLEAIKAQRIDVSTTTRIGSRPIEIKV